MNKMHDSKGKKYNVIIYNPDEFRGDALNNTLLHPNSKIKTVTPNFDKLASEGVAFKNCHTAHTVCTQSRTSFMTGWYTHVYGKRTLWNMLDENEPNLLKSFLREGYNVQWWGKNDLLAPNAFPVSVTNATSNGSAMKNMKPLFNFDTDPGKYMSFLFQTQGDEMKHQTSDYQNVQAACNFLKTHRRNSKNNNGNDIDDATKPFLLYLPLFYPHPPYTCPEPFYSMFDKDKDIAPLRKLKECRNKPDFYHLIRKYRYLEEIEDEDELLKQIRSVYLGACAYSDYCFGELMKGLKESGHEDDTIVVVFSDHGDWAGDYGLVEKWPSGLDNVLTHVPLIVKTPPGCTSFQAKGHVVEELVQLFDIVPTLYELNSIDNEASQYVHFGKSLSAQLNGNPGDLQRHIYAEGGFSTNEPKTFEGQSLPPEHPLYFNHIGGNKTNIYGPKGQQQQDNPLSVCRAVMVRNLKYKLVLRSDPSLINNDGSTINHSCELYDYRNDPFELKNIYGDKDYRDVQNQLEKHLLTWFLNTSDVTKGNEDPRQLPYAAKALEKRRLKLIEKRARVTSRL